jgi:hypothetical protein
MARAWYRGALLIGAVVLTGCGTVRQVTETLVGVERLRFRLAGVSEFRLAGIALAQKASPRDFSPMELAQLLQYQQRRSLPVELLLQVAVYNPNDGRAGRRRLPVTLTGLEWKLLIDETPTVSGDLGAPVELPGGGDTVLIPLRVKLDLYEFFAQRSWNELIELALAIGGARGSCARLMLQARPRVLTPLGELHSPGYITIVDKEFRSSLR